MRPYNIKEACVDENDLWSGILATIAFAIISTENRLKGYSPVQILFGRDIIFPIKCKVYYALIRQQKEAYINKDTT